METTTPESGEIKPKLCKDQPIWAEIKKKILTETIYKLLLPLLAIILSTILFKNLVL